MKEEQKESQRRGNVCYPDGPRAPGLDGVLAVSATLFAEDIPLESVTRRSRWPSPCRREPASGNPREARTEEQAEEDALPLLRPHLRLSHPLPGVPPLQILGRPSLWGCVSQRLPEIPSSVCPYACRPMTWKCPLGGDITPAKKPRP